jgi:hypothetical protein
LLVTKLNEINSKIKELDKSIDPESKLEKAELVDQRNKMTGAGFYEWLSGESDYGLLAELIRGRRYTAKIKIRDSIDNVVGKVTEKKTTLSDIESVNNIINKLRGSDEVALKEYGITSNKMRDQVIRKLERLSKKGSWDKIDKVFSDLINKRISRNDIDAVIKSYDMRGDIPKRYVSYMDKAMRLLGAYKNQDRETYYDNVMPYLSYLNDPAYREYIEYDQTRRISPELSKEREKIQYDNRDIITESRLDYPIIPEDRINYDAVNYDKYSTNPPYEPPVNPPPYEPPVNPPPYEPPVNPPPYEPPVNPPPYEPPPPPPVNEPIPDTGTLFSRIQTNSPPSQPIPDGSIAWATGELTHGKGKNRITRPVWKYIAPPYTDLKPKTMMYPPVGARNADSIKPEATIQVIGQARARVPGKVNIDLGWTDIEVLNGRTINFKSGGTKTDVGTRINSNTQGMSLSDGDFMNTDDYMQADNVLNNRQGVGHSMIKKSKPNRKDKKDKWLDKLTRVGRIQ